MHKIITTVFDKNQCFTANTRPKVLKGGTRMDGIIQETLTNTVCSSKMPSEVIQEAEEEEISEDEKSDE